MAEDPGELFVAGISGGQVWVAPRSATVPAGLEEPGAGWTDLGFLSEDGHSLSEETETSDIKLWQRNQVARTIVTGQTVEVKMALAQWNADTLALRFGGSWTSDSVSGVKTLKVPASRQWDLAMLIDSTDGGRTYRYVHEKASITGFEEISHKAGEPALLGMTVRVVPVDDVDWFELRTDDPAIAPVAITGVVAGTPGSFQPPGAAPPADLAALKADPVVGDAGSAKPAATPWTTGQYVDLGDASKASWGGTAWAAGPAALAAARRAGK
jgi:hypothetical protein